MSDLNKLSDRIRARREAVDAAGETFYQGPSRTDLASFPPKESWDDWVELDSHQWPKRVERHSMLIPTTCFNCESACGLLAYVDRSTLQVRKFEGNPEHPGSRGRNCAKGPATINQVTDPDRILYPLKRVGPRGQGRFERVSWDEALRDIANRLRTAILEERQNEIMIHLGRPGEDGYTERVLAAWGVDGHNSHTNVCSSGGRAGYHYWSGIDRPSADFANAKVIYLISSHLETGHYFNPHAQRITEARQRGAKLIVVDTRLSNTATHADLWISPWPGTEAAMNLAFANYLIQNDLYDREFVRRWWNWQEYLSAEAPTEPQTFENFEVHLKSIYADYTLEFAAAETRVDIETLREAAEIIGTSGTALSSHNWRSAAAGNLGGWQVSRTTFLLNALLGAVATPGGTNLNAWNKYVPRPIHTPGHPNVWNELSWPLEFPLAMNELSYLLPHLIERTGRRLEVYMTRVYNPVWTNPDGFSWIEMLLDEHKIGCYVALTPTWNETSFFADYILPMGHASERHDTFSYEQYDGQWIGFRQPVLKVARERLGGRVYDTREVNPGEVWEENEFYIELSWRIDPDGSLGIRQYFESRRHPGSKLTVEEYYSWMFENSVPGLPERAAAENLTPLEYMQRYGAFEIRNGVGQVFAEEVPASELEDLAVTPFGRVYSSAPKPVTSNIVPTGDPAPDDEGRRPVGITVDGAVRRGFPTPSGRLEFYSTTLADWGWKEYATPTYIKSHVHPERLTPDQFPLISTFRLPVQIHTRSANSKWLDEIAHTNPVWINPVDASRLSLSDGNLVRVNTDLGYFVAKTWVTEGIRPGVVACSHHMGRWRIGDLGSSAMMRSVSLAKEGTQWGMHPHGGAQPYESSDPDTARIWWTDIGVHQNLTFGVHPDPVSGMHCWHQVVTITKAEPEDLHGEVHVDTSRSRTIFERWMQLTQSAEDVSPNGTRRPRWLLRPLKPTTQAFELPTSV
ncbi:molybdopterin-dependent oxidoreductase [Ferrimicrobium sp.]|uniref:molybdopterin-dependent oxidoreductase n=1 Tax=Ferrimicrobium sp. TaxID=2926050 RepID=UPI00263414A2|nr:molybdopterin-dependent oxidoreductase [Ferrimicrobium sp.]